MYTARLAPHEAELGPALGARGVDGACGDADCRGDGAAACVMEAVGEAAPPPVLPPPWQCTQWRQEAQWPRRRAIVARSFSAGPSFRPRLLVRCSSVKSGNAEPSIDCSLNT
ncbi:Hypothetical predicted protein [Cloeon dipterum]|uniref:Uncharacterized protein n=1 Tax=Cloeon dipterum TaxID=197152 RepID=A0A8S1DQV1_9INSE|nr:Hypothetical predicted protein [Cloeon dipterum]